MTDPAEPLPPCTPTVGLAAAKPARLKRSLCAFAVAAAFAAIGGCSGTPLGPDLCTRPESEEPTAYHGGSLEDGIYMTSDWDGELLAFPGGAYYEIHHQLGEVPRSIGLFLSFERGGVPEGSLAPAAGNQAEIKLMDDESIVILNGTCGNYWLLVTATAGESGPN